MSKEHLCAISSSEQGTVVCKVQQCARGSSVQVAVVCKEQCLQGAVFARSSGVQRGRRLMGAVDLVSISDVGFQPRQKK